jgi:hypothetical protein
MAANTDWTGHDLTNFEVNNSTASRLDTLTPLIAKRRKRGIENTILERRSRKCTADGEKKRLTIQLAEEAYLKSAKTKKSTKTYNVTKVWACKENTNRSREFLCSIPGIVRRQWLKQCQVSPSTINLINTYKKDHNY